MDFDDMADTELISKLNELINSLNGLVDPLRSIASIPIAMMGIGQDMRAAQKAFSTMSTIIPGISGDALRSVGGYLESTRQTLESLDKFGIGLNDLGDMFERLNQLGLSEEQFRKFVVDAQSAISGGTAEEKARKAESVLLMAKETALGKQLIEQSSANLGVLAEAVMIESGRNGVMLESKEQMQAVAERAAVTAANLDSLARITGQNRDEIVAEMRERKASIDNRMFENLLSEEQRVQYTRTLMSLTDLGAGVQDLAQTMAMNGRYSEQEKQQLAVLGPEGAKLYQLMQMSVSKDLTPEKQQQLALELEALKVRVAEQQSSEQYFMMMKGSRTLGDTARDLASENKIRDSIAAQLEYERKTRPDVTAGEVYAETKKKVSYQQAGLTPTGELDQGQILSREIGRMMLEAQTQTAGLAGAINQLIENAFSAQGAVDAFGTAMRGVSAAAFGTGTAEEKKEAILGTPGALERLLTPDPASAQAPSAPVPDTLPGPVQQYNVGTFGVHGEWFKDFSEAGTFAKLHGKEAVVPFDQLNKFLEYADSVSSKVSSTGARPMEIGSPIGQDDRASTLGHDIENGIKQFMAMLSQFSSELFDRSDVHAKLQSTLVEQKKIVESKMPVGGATEGFFPKSDQSSLEQQFRGILGPIFSAFRLPNISDVMSKQRGFDPSDLISQEIPHEIGTQSPIERPQRSDRSPLGQKSRFDPSDLISQEIPHEIGTQSPIERPQRSDRSPLEQRFDSMVSSLLAEPEKPNAWYMSKAAHQKDQKSRFDPSDLISQEIPHEIGTQSPIERPQRSDRSPLEQRFDSMVSSLLAEPEKPNAWYMSKAAHQKDQSSLSKLFDPISDAISSTYKDVTSRMSDITSAASARVPSTSDIAAKMQGGITPISDKPFSKPTPTQSTPAPSAVSSMTGVIKSIENLSGMMHRSIGAPLADIRRSSRGTERATKKMKATVI